MTENKDNCPLITATLLRKWNVDPIDREKIRDLPNFDADVFYDISGIDLRTK